MLVGVAAAGLSQRHEESAGSVLYYLVIYAFTTIGAFAVAAWLARDLKERGIDELVPIWNILDLTRQGRGEFYAKLEYPSAA